jgi:uncharacterized linocin/CFP29 family protein
MHLNRGLAPFGAEIWTAIDEAAAEAAKAMLTARRFLDVDGPYGPGLTSIEMGNDGYCRTPEAGEAGAVVGRAVSVPMLRKTFELSIRRVAGHLEMGLPLDLSPVEDAAEAVAKREEEYIYRGNRDFGVPGLLTAEGRCSTKGGDWSDLDGVLDNVLQAITALDGNGYRGPYALILGPSLYNGLFRRYPGTELLQIEHLKRICAKGIFKADIEGAAVIDPRVGDIVVGQDLQAGYIGTDGIHYQMFLAESLVLRLQDADAVCTLSPSGGEGGHK